jgi:hypothetical protein
MLKKNFLANFQKIIELFNKKIVTKLSKIWVWDPGPGSGKNLFRIPGSKKHRIPDPRYFHIFGVGITSVSATYFAISQIFPEMQESKFRTQIAVVRAGPITSCKPFLLLHVDQLESDLVVLVDLENFSLLK